MSKAQGITMRSGGGNKKAKRMAGALMFQRFPNGTMKLMKPDDKIDVAAANAEGHTPKFFIIPEVSQVMVHVLIASMYAPIEIVIGNDNGKKISLWCQRDRWWITDDTKKTIWEHRLAYMEVMETKLDPNGPNDVMYEILAQFIHPMDRKERKDTIRMLAGKAVEAKALRDKKIASEETKTLTADNLALLLKWVKDLKLDKPTASAWHHLEHALVNCEILSPLKEAKVGTDYKLETKPQVFVIEHDWAAAFSQAKDFDGGSVKLPFELVAFELRISSLKVIALMSPTMFIPFVQVGEHWMVPQQTYYRLDDETWDYLPTQGMEVDFFLPLKNLILEQVRAVCIMLDAEVAESEAVEPSEKFNKARVDRGKVPLAKYHIVRLHSKYKKRSEQKGEPTGVRQRFHWVRGHFTHLDQEPMSNVIDQAWKFHDGRWRRWKNWFLRGDPDLGFVDKEYRL